MTAFAKTRAGSPSKTPAPMSSRDAASDTRNRARRTRTRPFRETRRCPCTEYTSSEKTMNKAAVFVNPLSPADTSNRGQRDSWEQEDRTTGGRGKTRKGRKEISITGKNQRTIRRESQAACRKGGSQDADRPV